MTLINIICYILVLYYRLYHLLNQFKTPFSSLDFKFLLKIELKFMILNNCLSTLALLNFNVLYVDCLLNNSNSISLFLFRKPHTIILTLYYMSFNNSMAVNLFKATKAHILLHQFKCFVMKLIFLKSSTMALYIPTNKLYMHIWVFAEAYKKALLFYRNCINLRFKGRDFYGCQSIENLKSISNDYYHLINLIKCNLALFTRYLFQLEFCLTIPCPKSQISQNLIFQSKNEIFLLSYLLELFGLNYHIILMKAFIFRLQAKCLNIFFKKTKIAVIVQILRT